MIDTTERSTGGGLGSAVSGDVIKADNQTIDLAVSAAIASQGPVSGERSAPESATPRLEQPASATDETIDTRHRQDGPTQMHRGKSRARIRASDIDIVALAWRERGVRRWRFNS